MKKTDFAYVAGIIDGEGCIEIHTQEYSSTGGRKREATLNIVVGSSDEWLCHFLRVGFGGYVYHDKREGKKGFEFWRWIISGNIAMEFLKLILPYLYLKQPQAEVAIRFQEKKPKIKYCRTNPKPDEVWAVQQAEAILLKEMKQQKQFREVLKKGESMITEDNLNEDQQKSFNQMTQEAGLNEERTLELIDEFCIQKKMTGLTVERYKFTPEGQKVARELARHKRRS